MTAEVEVLLRQARAGDGTVLGRMLERYRHYLTLLARGEFSIIVAKLAQAGGLAALLQPFAALYVLILATFAPLLAKESENIYSLFARVFTKRKRTPTAVELGET